jgi:hypothetical protein
VVVSDDEALQFLPPLPPFSKGPNEMKRNMNRIKSMTKDVEGILMGERIGGERKREVVEWGLECCVLKGSKGEEVLVYRVIGMEGV